MTKISVQQRKYFVTRIENSINDKIETLRQSNAAPVSYTHLTLPTTPYV